MTLAPATLSDLSRQLAAAHAARLPITSVDLAALAAVREHTPEDMTITVEAGMSLAALQALLATHRQWLPIDPPHPGRLTIRELLSENLFGPRRCGFGTIREHLIGLEAVLADGRITHSGGKVVKNVAGYDLLKLFVGARDSLGIITAASFKLRPLPEQEILLSAQFPTLDAAWAAIEAILQSPITPVILDLHNLSQTGSASGTFTVELGLAGTREEVEWQRLRAGDSSLSLHPMRGEGRGDGFPSAPQNPQQSFWSVATPPQTLSVLPSQLPAAIASLGQAPFIAHAANGILHHRALPRGGDLQSPSLAPNTPDGECDSPARSATALPCPVAPPSTLAQRLKATFDPHHILPVAPR
ncbi:MAG: FAD-binding oxidoreductase [Verrucomicrobia bacterium]|nr:FAD-binding oxidoreductase [Verrucomicrobiota bacterium]